MKRISLVFSLSLLTGGLLGCGGQGPAPPTLGEQIDRAGHPFNLFLVAPFDDATTRNTMQNAYNAAADSEQWVFTFRDRMRANMAVWDGLIGRATVNTTTGAQTGLLVCGDQVGTFGSAAPESYDFGAIAFAYDVLFVNTESTSSNFYLGVEANFFAPYYPRTAWINNDSGGRAPTSDAIDQLYTSLGMREYVSSVSALVAQYSPPVTDGVARPTTNAPSDTEFPFLAEPATTQQ